MDDAARDDELVAILSEIDRFARRAVEPTAMRPEAPMAASAMSRLVDEARTLGLWGGEPDEGGLWADDDTSGLRSVASLARLAEANAAFALVVHLRALGSRAARAAPARPTGPCVLALQGRFGVGGGALARWLSSASLADGDRELLGDVYGHESERMLTCDEGFTRIAAPVFGDDCGVTFVLAERSELTMRRHEHAHGFDELETCSFRLPASAPALDLPGPRDGFAQLSSFAGLGLVAIGLGAARRALGIATTYAATRCQGGVPIERHAAVQALVGGARAAIDLVDRALASTSRAPTPGAVAGLRAECHPLLCRAANDAMQVLGGTGYLRDAGVEKVVRDENHLRAMLGSPTEQTLFVAEWERLRARAAQPPSPPRPAPVPRPAGGRTKGLEAGARALEGHVPPASPLSPRSAFAGFGRIVRGLVRYEPADPWELDTSLLPRPLAAYRRRMRAFAEAELAPRALASDAAAHRAPGELEPQERNLLITAGRAGLLSDLLPRPLGSMAPGLLRYPLFLPQALKTEELAAADGGLMLLVSAHDLGVAPVVLSGDLGLVRRALLPAFRASERGEPHVFAYAITEPAAGSDVEDGHGAERLAPGVVARVDGAGFRLSGKKCFISGGDVAKTIVVFAALEGRGIESWTAFLVDAAAPGLRVPRTELKMGMRASGAAELDLDDVFVPAAAIVGGVGRGWALNRATLNMSRIPVAAMAVGFARAATELATDFACRFSLGGKALIDYQDVQLALAQMLADTQAARALVWRAAQLPQARQADASIAKFWCSDAARRTCERAMDLLGNHAVLHGERVEKALRDVRLTQIFEGTNEINRIAVIEDHQERLLDRVERSRRP